MIYDKTSAKTAIARKKISLPVKWLQEQNLLKGSVLDYGCGRGHDATLIGADKYDPFYFPELPAKKYDTIICIYVLNVVKPSHVDEVIESLSKHLAPGGTVYLAVRRDIAAEGKTKTGTEQWNVKLPNPVVVEKKNKFCIYTT
jgi:2-polyprenyl-3-methyl-5-hydroxy-6-metoxy-1,4-benzoquinol methylase